MTAPGYVHLVGGGPGDPDLITVKAARALAAADVVVHDRLAAPALLDLAPPDALRVDVGKAAGSAPVTQEEINALLVEHAAAGRRVVRLKGGDPFVFGRGGEEAGALIQAGIAFEVVPGVSAALSAPGAAGIPVTMRHGASAFVVATGHEDPDDTSVPWETFAASGATIVILMGTARIGAIAARLVDGGLDPTTPVTAIRWATTDRQEVLRSDLARVGSLALQAPATIVVGRVAGLDLRSPLPLDG